MSGVLVSYLVSFIICNFNGQIITIYPGINRDLPAGFDTYLTSNWLTKYFLDLGLLAIVDDPAPPA